ncbi:GNAT family N-acetyltransferase [Achromobacter sp. AONIH1]|nr:GNAT family N-acetyltransferase [Achromobacter sp. AONIH1]
MMMYDDAITRCIGAENPLPQWYVLRDGARLVGCAGLITNDFISRGELYPWLCALHVEQDLRGRNLGGRLIRHAADHARALGFRSLHLCSDLRGYYEKFGFQPDGVGYHPWGETAQVYSLRL